MLYVPNKNNWYTINKEYGDTGNIVGGGVVLFSEGRWEAPIQVVYGWNSKGEFKGRVYRFISDVDEYLIDDVPENPVHPNKNSIVSFAYSPEACAEANNEKEALELANEYQGGEYDIIHSMMNSNDENDEQNPDIELLGKVDNVYVTLNDHQTAINIMISITMELFGGVINE
jgi:hypothetical protein